MYIYMGHMKFEHTKPYEDWFWNKNRINLIKDYVKTLNTQDKTLLFDSSKSIAYDKLIIASGSKPNKFGWPGENLNGVQGLYSIQDLEEMEKITKNISSAVLVDGGLIGIEMAEMLHSRSTKVTMLVRENLYWRNVFSARICLLATGISIKIKPAGILFFVFLAFKVFLPFPK